MLIGTGWFVDLALAWPSVISGTFTSIGAVVLLAFVVFAMERRFMRVITKKVEETTRTIVSNETERLSSRLADLETELATHRQRERSIDDSAVDAIADDVSFGAVTSALDRAQNAAAISRQLIVSGSTKDPLLLVGFDWGHRVERTLRGSVLHEEEDPILEVFAFVHSSDGSNDRAASLYVSTLWTSDEEAVDVAESLQAELARRERSTAKQLDFPHAVRELQRGLRLAIADAHADVGEETLLGHQLREVLSGDWIVTDGALQNLRSGYRAGPEDLGFAISGQNVFSGPTYARSPGEPLPAAPRGVDSKQWEFVFERASRSFSG